jgi:hypothetical protein
VHLGGNIGHPLLAETASINPEDIAVLELSSFQLMNMKTSPRIAVTTNLSPNHLDVHKDYAEYIDAKANIFTHQAAEELSVFNADNPDSVIQAAKAPGRVRWFSRRKELEEGVFLRDKAVICRVNGTERQVMTTNDIKLPGIHNVENYLAAIAALGADAERAYGDGNVVHHNDEVLSLDVLLIHPISHSLAAEVHIGRGFHHNKGAALPAHLRLGGIPVGRKSTTCTLHKEVHHIETSIMSGALILGTDISKSYNEIFHNIGFSFLPSEEFFQKFSNHPTKVRIKS